jgi:hypothetical protein
LAQRHRRGMTDRTGCSRFRPQGFKLTTPANFLVPVRPLDGPSPVVWQPASNACILQVLKNPAYAGAYGNTGKARPNTKKPAATKGSRIRMESSTWMLAECSKPARASLLIDQV